MLLKVSTEMLARGSNENLLNVPTRIQPKSPFGNFIWKLVSICSSKFSSEISSEVAAGLFPEGTGISSKNCIEIISEIHSRIYQEIMRIILLKVLPGTLAQDALIFLRCPQEFP